MLPCPPNSIRVVSLSEPDARGRAKRKLRECSLSFEPTARVGWAVRMDKVPYRQPGAQTMLAVAAGIDRTPAIPAAQFVEKQG